MDGYFRGYAVVGLLALAGVGFVASALAANRLIRPHRPSAAKLGTYECGVDPVGEGWAQTQVRYYVYAFLYVVFAVEAVFVLPWVTVIAKRELGVPVLLDMAGFVGLLLLGLLYVWRKRVLEWT